MHTNPFEFEAANKFSVEEMVDYFISDENYTRFLASRKNLYLVGDRGTGKTMALRFFSLPVQHCFSRRSEYSGGSIFNIIGVYVPCRKPDLGKTEPDLLDPFLGRLNGEHLLITAMVAGLADALNAVGAIISPDEELQLRNEIPFLLNWELPIGKPVFAALGAAARRESIQAQRALNRRTVDSHYENVATFATTFQPLVEILTTTVASLRDSHFSLMFDDAEDLSAFQNETLNSWIAVRDTSRISFKVATSAVDQRALRTSSGGGLLERHDFIWVNLEQDFQNSEAAYGKMARKIVDRRLTQIGFNDGADAFFPANSLLAEALATASEQARTEAVKLGLTGRQIRDYVHKMERALYFRNRPAQANRPPYSGFDLLVHVSTGVIRYLLEPCYEMYDKALSERPNNAEPVKIIPPRIQTECLERMSKRRWEWIKSGFNCSIKGCTAADAVHIYNLVDQLAVLFRRRLEQHNSEPRAISFSVSGSGNLDATRIEQLEHVLLAARRAQILFQRRSTAKVEGRSEIYYTFDRLLWIDRGLDPVGQNARVSIEARYLHEAAFQNRPLPYDGSEKRALSDAEDPQLTIFDRTSHND